MAAADGSGTASTIESSLDGMVCMMALSIPLSSPLSFTLPPPARNPRLSAKHHQCSADSDLVPEAQQISILHAIAIDVSSVGAAQIFKDPFPVGIGVQFKMPAADGVVGERKLSAIPANLRGGVGQLKSPPFVGTL